MVNAISYRGQDSLSYVILGDETTILGYTCLLIIDLTADSNLPLWSSEKIHYINFSSEIY